jgi:hypothetical protein
VSSTKPSAARLGAFVVSPPGSPTLAVRPRRGSSSCSEAALSTAILLSLLSPLLLLVAVVGVVAVVALVQAESNDVPEVARAFCSIFRRLAERTPGAKLLPHSIRDDVAETQVVDEDAQLALVVSTAELSNTDNDVADVAHTVPGEVVSEEGA